MATKKEPGSERQALGDEIARLRVRKGWSRPKLLRALDEVLDYDHRLSGERALARLEDGEFVKISRQLLEALCDVLNCTDGERTRIMLLADRNILVTIPGKITPMMEVFSRLMAEFYSDVCELVAQQTGNQPVETLPQTELDELFYEALLAVIKDRQGESGVSV